MEDIQKKNLQKKNTKKYLAYVVGIFVLLAVIGSCTSNGNTEELNSQISELQEENEKLTKQVEELQEEKDALEKQIEEKQKLLAELKPEKESSNEDYATLREENETLKSQMAELETQVQEAESRAQEAENKVQALEEQVQKASGNVGNTANFSEDGNVSQSSSSVSAQDTQSYTVYVTKTGSKYHKSGCRYLSNSQIAMDKNEAISKGYSACSVCNP